MKKCIALLLSSLLLLGVFSLAGCGKKEADLSDAIHLEYDRRQAVLKKTTLESKDGAWRIVIHACTTKEDLKSRRTYFENTLTSIANQDVVSDEKTFGSLTFRTEYHTANGQFAGSYFTEFESPVKTKSLMYPLYGIYCYVAAEDSSFVDEIESAMSGLYVQAVG